MLDYSRIISYFLSYFEKLSSLLILLLLPYISFIKDYLNVLKTIKKDVSVYMAVNGTSIQVNGNCSAGYEPVKDLFIQNFKDGLEDNAQLCIYVNNVCVVDLYGTASGDTDYGPDNVQVVV